MLKSAGNKALWVFKGMALFGGAVVTLALVLGVASMAFGANGRPLILGENNTASLLTRLTGNVQGAAMRIVNNDEDADDTALNLSVQPGEAPLRVNSSTLVSNLNADLVDGRGAAAFVANSTYRLGQGQERTGTVLGDGSKVLSQSCLPGDRLLSGGPASVNAASDVLDSFAADTTTWQARINDSAVSGGDSFTVVVLCADQ